MSPGWCEEGEPFGPFANNTASLSMCFCATVMELPLPLLFVGVSLPRVATVMRQPFVAPSKSLSFSLKLALSTVCLVCALLIALFGNNSLSNLFAQTATAFGWLVSMVMLIAGYIRAIPQLNRLRLWWILQFIVNLVVFVNHSTLHPSLDVHIIRGLSLACNLLLIPLSLVSPIDVPKYEEISLHEHHLISPPPSGVYGNNNNHNPPSSFSLRGSNGTDLASQTFAVDSRTALLSSPEARKSYHSSSSASSSSSDVPTAVSTAPLVAGAASAQPIPARNHFASQLSQTTLYGATSTPYKSAIHAWDVAMSQTRHAGSLGGGNSSGGGERASPISRGSYTNNGMNGLDAGSGSSSLLGSGSASGKRGMLGDFGNFDETAEEEEEGGD